MIDERKPLLADEYLTGGLVREATYSEEAQIMATRLPFHLRRYVPVEPMGVLEVRDFYEKEVLLRDDRIKELEDAISKAAKKADGRGMGRWPEFQMLRKVLNKKVP